MSEIEQAVNKMLEQDDFGDTGSSENDRHWAARFKQDWDKGGVHARGKWFPFRGLADALRGWMAEMEQPVSQGFLLAVRELFKGDVASQATVDYMISRSEYE